MREGITILNLLPFKGSRLVTDGYALEIKVRLFDLFIYAKSFDPFLEFCQKSATSERQSRHPGNLIFSFPRKSFIGYGRD